VAGQVADVLGKLAQGIFPAALDDPGLHARAGQFARCETPSIARTHNKNVAVGVGMGLQHRLDRL